MVGAWSPCSRFVCVSVIFLIRLITRVPNHSQALLELAKKKEPHSTDELIAILGHLASALERCFCD